VSILLAFIAFISISSVTMLVFLPPATPRLIGKAQSVSEAYKLLHPTRHINGTYVRRKREGVKRELPPWEKRDHNNRKRGGAALARGGDSSSHTPAHTSEDNDKMEKKREVEESKVEITSNEKSNMHPSSLSPPPSSTPLPTSAEAQAENSRSTYPNPLLHYNCHLFYYAWYGNPATDGEWIHWNHEYLPHWEKSVNQKYPIGKKHVPPDDIGADFYPSLGPYSSNDEAVMREHMMQVERSGCGTIFLSWWGRHEKADSNGKPTSEGMIRTLMSTAAERGIKVGFHIEPYDDRSAMSVREDIKYLIDSFGQHPAFYVLDDGRPLVYIYDSYKTEASEWRTVLTSSGDHSIRNTPVDAFAVGLWVEAQDGQKLAKAGFDGAYSYFAADRFVFGSTRQNWPRMSSECKSNGMVFIPSVGPGYKDTRVRPWNDMNTKDRQTGAYYKQGFEHAKRAGVRFVSITSFNEWHEGTQIEAASVRQGYLDYSDVGDDYSYLSMTMQELAAFV